jgi:hypothetical protein
VWSRLIACGPIVNRLSIGYSPGTSTSLFILSAHFGRAKLKQTPGQRVPAMTAKPLVGLFIFLCEPGFGQQDIDIDHIEFVQVAQDRDNSVPLVAGKSTVVRVVLNQEIATGVSGSLIADGFPETLKPLGDRPPDSLNFLLPHSWTNSPGVLQVHATASLNGGPEKLQTASATFQAPPAWPSVFRVFNIDVCAPDAGGKRQCASNFGDVSDLMQRVYPLTDGAVEYNPIAAGSIDWPGKLDSAAEQIRFTRFLTAYYYLLDQTAPVDQLFAWLPFGGGAQSVASARGGGLGHVWWDTADSDRVNNAQALARGIAYNLGLGDGDAGWLAPATFQTLFNTQALAPATAQASAEYLILGGTLTPDGSVAQLDPGYRVISSRPGAPSDPNGTHCLRFSGGDAADYCFTPFFTDPTGAGGFEIKAPIPSGTTRVALLSGGTELTALTAAADAPVLSIVAPRTGDTWQGKRTLQWTGSDPGGNPLIYAVQYSADNGASWTPLTLDLKETQYEVDGTRISGSQVLFRILASNGLRTTTAVVGPVFVTQSPKLNLGQPSLGFQNVTVGQIADRTLLVTNTGSGPLTVRGRIAAGSFRLVSSAGSLVIPAGGQRAITVRWAPTASGPLQETLALTSSDPALAGVNVTLSGVAFDNLVPAIITGAASIDFGSVNAGQTKDLKVTISNIGSGALTVSSVGSSNAQFSVVAPSLPVTIPPGQPIDVMVRFSPNASGGIAGVLSIVSNDPTRGAITVAVTGTGGAGPVASIAVAPESLDFGGVVLGQTKDSKLTVRNTGSAGLTVRSITSSSAAFAVVSPAVPFTVAAGNSTDVTVRFAPSAGAVSASLTIASNDPAKSSLTIPLSGSGIQNAQPSIAVAPTSLDFGGVTTGQTKDSTLTVSNNGTVDLTVGSISIGGSAFTIVSTVVPFTVAAGRSTAVTVRFSPSSAGAASASLTIGSNDSVRPSLTVPLAGIGLAPAVNNVLRTIAYHEITSLTTPMDVSNYPVMSRNGTRAFFTVKNTELWMINTDGSGARKIDTDTTLSTHFFSVSDDGAKALVWNAVFLRIVNTDGSGASSVLTSSDGAIQGARLSGDGKTIVFINGHANGVLAVSSGSRLAERGIWAINSDGTNLREITGSPEAGGLLGVGDVLMSFDGGAGVLDVSSNGGRIVFGVAAGARGRALMAVNGDRTSLRVLRAGLATLFGAAISGDGSTVAYTATVSSGATELDVIRFDGTGALTLSARSGLYALQMSSDGSLVYAGAAGTGLLGRTDGSSLTQLFAPVFGNPAQLAAENPGFNFSSMSGDGTRFLFTVPSLRYSQTGIIELAMADLNPLSLGAAPVMVNPTVDPSSIPADGAGYRAIIGVKVTSATPIAAASAQSFLQGFPDQVGTILTDTGNGAWMGSFFYTTTVSGPRVIRVKAETQSADGKRHATAVDFGGFSVGPK